MIVQKKSLYSTYADHNVTVNLWKFYLYVAFAFIFFLLCCSRSSFIGIFVNSMRYTNTIFHGSDKVVKSSWIINNTIIVVCWLLNYYLTTAFDIRLYFSFHFSFQCNIFNFDYLWILIVHLKLIGRTNWIGSCLCC